MPAWLVNSWRSIAVRRPKGAYKRPAGLGLAWEHSRRPPRLFGTDCSRFEELGALAGRARGLVVDLEGIFGAAAINQGQRVVLVKGGSAGLDGGIRVDGRQERDLGDELVTASERRF